jgi:hypothetical protein
MKLLFALLLVAGAARGQTTTTSGGSITIPAGFVWASTASNAPQKDTVPVLILFQDTTHYFYTSY